MEEAEKLILLDTIEQSGDNKSVLTKVLDISLRTCVIRLKNVICNKVLRVVGETFFYFNESASTNF